MKIIQVYQTNPFREGQGGGVRYVKNLLSGIKSECDEILFLGLGENEKIKDKITLIPITKNITGYIKFLFRLMIKLPLLDLSKYDVVHVHRLYFAIPFILLKPRLKIVCSMHGRTFSVFESNNGNWKLKLIKPFFMMIEKFSIKHIDYLVPVSQDVINDFKIKYSDFEKNQMEVIGSMLNLDNFFITDSDFLQAKYGVNNKYVLFIGRLSDVKDIEFFISLWSEKFQQLSHIKLVIAGDGEDKNKLLSLSNQLCKLNEPIFLGEIAPENITKLIASSNITTLCSKHEASPTVVKESLSCGIPMITNNIGDAVDYIKDNKNGYIVNKDYNSYFNAIKQLLGNPLSKKEVLKNSTEQLKECSVEHVSNKYLEIYKKVLN